MSRVVCRLVQVIVLTVCLPTVISCGEAFRVQDIGQPKSTSASTQDPGNGPTQQPSSNPPPAGQGSGGGGGFPSVPPLAPLPPGQGTFKILDELKGLRKGAEQNRAFCQSSGNVNPRDRVRDRFCSGNFPKVTNLPELLLLLGLSPTDIGPDRSTGVAFETQSPSIATRSVSTINPRIHFFENIVGANTNDLFSDLGTVTIAYVRGEPYIEISAQSEVSIYTSNNLYLIRLEKACESTDSCSPAEFLTEQFEYNWSGITIYEDNDLVRTTLDCKHCHIARVEGALQRGQNIFLMPEDVLDSNFAFNHWLDGNSKGSSKVEILKNFLGANGKVGLVGAPQLELSDPSNLWFHGYWAGHFHSDYLFTQPISYNTAKINTEFSQAGSSKTWKTLFDRFQLGQTPPPPHFKSDVTDPEKIARATQLMQQYRSGTIRPEQLPDFRDVFLDSEKIHLGMRTDEGLSPRQTITASCGQCHNGTNALTFNALSDESVQIFKQQILDRIARPNSDAGKMPPLRFRELSNSQIQKIGDYLR